MHSNSLAVQSMNRLYLVKLINWLTLPSLSPRAYCNQYYVVFAPGVIQHSTVATIQNVNNVKDRKWPLWNRYIHHRTHLSPVFGVGMGQYHNFNFDTISINIRLLKACHDARTQAQTIHKIQYEMQYSGTQCRSQSNGRVSKTASSHRFVANITLHLAGKAVVIFIK